MQCRDAWSLALSSLMNSRCLGRTVAQRLTCDDALSDHEGSDRRDKPISEPHRECSMSIGNYSYKDQDTRLLTACRRLVLKMLRKGAASVVARASPPLRRAGARQGRLLYAHHQSSSAFAFRQTWSFSRALHGTTASDLGSQPALETKIPDAGAADVIEAVADGTATGSSGVPVSMDLLELYRGLVAQGRLKWDDEQVRTVMQVSIRLFHEVMLCV